MKNLIFSCCFFVVAIALQAQQTSVFPSPKGFINDYESDFTPDQVKALDYAVKDLLTKTMQNDSLKDIEIAVVTVTDKMYGNEKDISGYVTRLGDKWGVGKNGVNKAIIIAYGKKIRKVAIVTGAGLDNILPASTCHKIIDEKMSPQFKKGDYYQAILDAINGIKDQFGLL